MEPLLTTQEKHYARYVTQEIYVSVVAYGRAPKDIIVRMGRAYRVQSIIIMTKVECTLTAILFRKDFMAISKVSTVFGTSNAHMAIIAHF